MMSKEVMSKEVMNKEVMNTATSFPLFYRQIEAFNSELHGPLQRPASANYAFAAQAAVIPLVVSELPQALRHYPLVFLPASADAAPTLAVVVGLGNQHNLFVEADGNWKPSTYIPAYVRRYPFHALRIETQPEPLLAIDPGYIAAEEGETLVDAEGNPSSFLQESLALTRDYLVAAEQTDAICRALQEAGVLEYADISLENADGAQHRINGFLSVNEARMRSLTIDALVKLQQADAIGLAYAQLLSMVNFTHLPLPDTAKPTNTPLH
jgi:hypothetical protein